MQLYKYRYNKQKNWWFSNEITHNSEGGKVLQINFKGKRDIAIYLKET